MVVFLVFGPTFWVLWIHACQSVSPSVTKVMILPTIGFLSFWTPDLSRTGSYRISAVSSQLQLRSGLGILVHPSVSYQKLRKTAPRIFLVFCMKLGDQKVRKITRPDFSRKISILRFLAFYGQNGLKSDSLSIYSKMVPPILLILHIQID